MPENNLDGPRYLGPPIESLSDLARTLQCPPETLLAISRCPTFKLYRQVRIPKPDGGDRICFDANPPLKEVQDRIKDEILGMVEYPTYLKGGVKGRDYVANAAAHVGAAWIINQDIASFFPSTRSAIVFSIWREFFGFPHDVAKLLTRLTTRDGTLPQGAKTSSYLANLAFWREEPELVASLRKMGFRYTRYVDDVTISSQTFRTKDQKKRAMSLFAAMLRQRGFRFKRSKEKIVSRGRRMEVTGLVVRDDGVGLRKEDRAKIRAQVHQCEVMLRQGRPEECLCQLSSARSRVAQYCRHHQGQGHKLNERLDAVEKNL
jgi:retron-type reverse transcriptase